MGNSNGIITAPVSIQGDIAYVLGVGSGDIGILCSSSAINMWSINKPVRLGTPYHTQNWQAAWSGNYGIAPHRHTGQSPLASLYSYTYDGLENGWIYENPRGTENGHNEWYRVLDFNGYNHFSPRPWSGMTAVTSALVGGNVWFGLDNVITDWSGTTPNSIYYGNILLGQSLTSKRLSDCYFGIAIFDRNGNCIGITTCQNKMGATEPLYSEDGNWSCGFDNINWPTGNYEAIPFFWISDTDGPMPLGWTSLQYGEVYTIPYTLPVRVSIYSAESSITFTTSWAGLDPDPPTGYVNIGVYLAFTTHNVYRYRLDSFTLKIRPEKYSTYETLYDSSDPSSGFVATDISGDGNEWPIVSNPSYMAPITTCPDEFQKAALPSGDYYYMSFEAQLYCYNENRTITIRPAYNDDTDRYELQIT